MIPPLVFRTLGLVAVIFLLTSVDFSSAKMQGRIVGGKPSAPGAWPFMAAIFAQFNASAPATHGCGGVIWNEDTILTAAHCLIDDDKDPVEPLPAAIFSVLLGQTDISSPVPEYTFQAAKLLIHPAYTHEGIGYDIGLIKLARPIDFAGAHPKAGCICDPLPVSSVDGATCLAIGWGLTDPTAQETSPILLQVDQPLLPQEVCGKDDDSYNASMNVCTGYLGVPGKGTCAGDSGGPLLCSLTGQPSKYNLVGLTAYGPFTCDTREFPEYYTKVETHLGWIGKASGE